jgi:spore maturation protein CgeB
MVGKIKKSIIINQLTPPDEIVKYYNGAKININIHRSSNDTSAVFNSRNIPAETPNNRTFDIAACNSFQLCELRNNLKEFYTIDTEIKTFNNIIDLKEKIEFYLSRETERKIIAKRANIRTLKEHTFLNRVKEIINNARK